MNIKCREELANDLDKEQLAAVEAPLSNTCVFAIAGSGKTRVLTYRVANLIDNNIPEKEMLLLTFTNKAAGEMVKRIKNILGKEKLNLLSGTFHSIACKFLRKFAHVIDYDSNFTIIDANAAKNLMDKCRDNYLASYSSPEDEFPSKNVLIDIYSGAINHQLSFDEYTKKYYPYYKGETIDAIILIFEDYVNKKISDNLMDFDDLLLNFLDVLMNDEARKTITDYYKYIFVDEYQDINWIQYEILELLNQHNCIFVIGDPCQCIYQFRGSDEKYIKIFQETHENVNSYKLTYNYRSAPEILLLAQDTINRNELPYEVMLHTKNPEYSIPYIYGTNDEIEEITKLAAIINMNYVDNLNNVAILVRRGTQINRVQQILETYGISCNLMGDKSLYENYYIQNLISLMQFKINYKNKIVFLNTSRIFGGIGEVLANQMYEVFADNNYVFYGLPSINNKTSYAFEILRKIVEYQQQDISDLISYICNIYYKNYMYNKYENFEEKYADIEYLIRITKGSKDIENFLDAVTLDKVSQQSSTNSVTVTTMHKSKGLEWDIVFLPFIDKGEYPRCRERDYVDNTFNVQNERNLFYVAITRAKKQLFLSYSLTYEDKPCGPSPFLEELDPEGYESIFYDNEQNNENEDNNEE